MRSRKQIEDALTRTIDELAGERRKGESLEDYAARVRKRSELVARRQKLLPGRMAFLKEIREATARARQKIRLAPTGPREKEPPGCRGRETKPTRRMKPRSVKARKPDRRRHR